MTPLNVRQDIGLRRGKSSLIRKYSGTVLNKIINNGIMVRSAKKIHQENFSDIDGG